MSESTDPERLQELIDVYAATAQTADQFCCNLYDHYRCYFFSKDTKNIQISRCSKVIDTQTGVGSPEGCDMASS